MLLARARGFGVVAKCLDERRNPRLRRDGGVLTYCPVFSIVVALVTEACLVSSRHGQQNAGKAPRDPGQAAGDSTPGRPKAVSSPRPGLETHRSNTRSVYRSGAPRRCTRETKGMWSPSRSPAAPAHTIPLVTTNSSQLCPWGHLCFHTSRCCGGSDMLMPRGNAARSPAPAQGSVRLSLPRSLRNQGTDVTEVALLPPRTDSARTVTQVYSDLNHI